MKYIINTKQEKPIRNLNTEYCKYLNKEESLLSKIEDNIYKFNDTLYCFKHINKTIIEGELNEVSLKDIKWFKTLKNAFIYINNK